MIAIQNAPDVPVARNGDKRSFCSLVLFASSGFQGGGGGGGWQSGAVDTTYPS